MTPKEILAHWNSFMTLRGEHATTYRKKRARIEHQRRTSLSRSLTACRGSGAKKLEHEVTIGIMCQRGHLSPGYSGWDLLELRIRGEVQCRSPP